MSETKARFSAPKVVFITTSFIPLMMNVTKEIVIKSPGIMEIWQILVESIARNGMSQIFKRLPKVRGRYKE